MRNDWCAKIYDIVILCVFQRIDNILQSNRIQYDSLKNRKYPNKFMEICIIHRQKHIYVYALRNKVSTLQRMF